MLGISYGEVLLLLGATAAVIGPKDLPVIARTVGRLAGRSIGYVQMARGQFQSIMQQTQALQVHKDLQETMSQLEAIRHEARSLSLLNSGPLMTRLVDNISGQPTMPKVNKESSDCPLDNTIKLEATKTTSITKDHSSTTQSLTDIHSQTSTYARLAESANSMK